LPACRVRLLYPSNFALASASHETLLEEIARDGIEIGLGILNRLGVANTQHPQIDLLDEVGGFGLGLEAPMEKRLQAAPLREQSREERASRLSHAALCDRADRSPSTTSLPPPSWTPKSLPSEISMSNRRDKRSMSPERVPATRTVSALGDTANARPGDR